MNYLKVYCNLIRKAQHRQVVEGYTEKHHIFPVSIFGKNDRIVVLTGREHYVAHALLEKIYLKRYGNNHIFTEKMIYAHFLMKDGRRYYNSILYENVRKRVSKIHSKNFSGENNPRYGKIGVYKHTEKTKEKQRNFNIENNIRPPKMGGWNKGKKYSAITREKMRQSQLGKKYSEETIEKMSNSRKGRKWWNNGIENKFCKECPGKQWILGKMGKTTKGFKWWNDRQINKYALECPGNEWICGRIKATSRNCNSSK